MHIMDMLGQFLIGLFFVIMAIYNFTNRTHFLGSIQAKHPSFPAWIIQGAVLLELLGGVLVIIGYGQKLAAIYLIVFTLIISFLLHPFWQGKGREFWKQLIVVAGNLAVVGGLFLILAMHG